MSGEQRSDTAVQMVSVGPVSVEIPQDWSMVSLGDISNNSGQYGANASANEYDPNEFRYVRITDISESGELKDDGKQSIPKAENEKYRLNEGDLLFARTGSVGRSYLHSDDNSNSDCAFAGYLIRFELTDEVCTEYINQFTKSLYFQKWVDSMARSTTHANINASEYNSLKIPYPPQPEQRRIANILSTVDEQIQQTDEKIEKTKELKRGLLQDAFKTYFGEYDKLESTPIGEIPREWDLVLTSDVADVIDGNSFPKEYQGESSGDLPFVKVSDTNDYHKYVSGAENYIDRSDLQEINCNIQPVGTVILPKRGAAILTNKRRILEQEAIIDNNQIGIKGNTVNESFLYHYLCTVDMGRYVQRGSVKSINKSTITSLKIPLPSEAEQKRIGDILDTVDEKLANERELRKELQKLKHGLMQDLLTGKVRVNDKTIEEN